MYGTFICCNNFVLPRIVDFLIFPALSLSLECDVTEVSEDVGVLEVCVVLTVGTPTAEFIVDVQTICVEACCKSNINMNRSCDTSIIVHV